jgi:hypothetical protein
MSSYKGGLTTKHVEKNTQSQPDVIIPLVTFVGITGLIVFRDEERKSLLIKLITNKLFLVSLTGIIVFCVYQLNQVDDDDETNRRKRATREAILGLIIAILAYLDLKAAPFFIIWIVSYYLDK